METEEVTQLVEDAPTEPVSRSWAFGATPGLVATFDATAILLQSIVEIAVGAMLHASTQRRPDGTGFSGASSSETSDTTSARA